jgi:sporulation-control protein spo0M
MSIKPYFRPKDTYNVKLDELEVTTEPDKLEVTAELDKPEATAELDKLEAPLPTLEVL